MSTSFLQPGDVLEYTAPAGGVTKGVGVLIGNTILIPTDTHAAGVQFRGMRVGVHRVAKPGSQAWAEGAIVYFDNAAKLFTTVSAGNFRAGSAAAAVDGAAGSTTGFVCLNGVAVTAVGGAAP